jgi:hypothetical protein
MPRGSVGGVAHVFAEELGLHHHHCGRGARADLTAISTQGRLGHGQGARSTAGGTAAAARGVGSDDLAALRPRLVERLRGLLPHAFKQHGGGDLVVQDDGLPACRPHRMQNRDAVRASQQHLTRQWLVKRCLGCGVLHARGLGPGVQQQRAAQQLEWVHRAEGDWGGCNTRAVMKKSTVGFYFDQARARTKLVHARLNPSAPTKGSTWGGSTEPSRTHRR